MENDDTLPRGVRWGKMLGFQVGSAKSRDYYNSERATLLRPPPAPEADDMLLHHPLSQHPESIWNQYWNVQELTKTIMLDLNRLHMEEVLEIKNSLDCLCRVLTVWSLQHPETSYKQGMHELLGVLFLVVYRDCSENLPADAGREWHRPAPDAWAVDDDAALLDWRYLEHDVFTVFAALMGGGDFGPPRMLTYFEDRKVPLEGRDRGRSAGPPALVSTVVGAAQRVYTLLAAADPQLHHHLLELGVEPQLFLLRWLRLLFEREFHLEDVLVVWDSLFVVFFRLGEGACLTRIVEAFAVAMVLFVRPALVEHEDAHQCLRRLMKFPPVEDVTVLVETACDLLLLPPDARRALGFLSAAHVEQSGDALGIEIVTERYANMQQPAGDALMQSLSARLDADAKADVDADASSPSSPPASLHAPLAPLELLLSPDSLPALEAPCPTRAPAPSSFPSISPPPPKWDREFRSAGAGAGMAEDNLNLEVPAPMPVASKKRQGAKHSPAAVAAARSRREEGSSSSAVEQLFDDMDGILRDISGGDLEGAERAYPAKPERPDSRSGPRGSGSPAAARSQGALGLFKLDSTVVSGMQEAVSDAMHGAKSLFGSAAALFDTPEEEGATRSSWESTSLRNEHIFDAADPPLFEPTVVPMAETSNLKEHATSDATPIRARDVDTSAPQREAIGKRVAESSSLSSWAQESIPPEEKHRKNSRLLLGVTPVQYRDEVEPRGASPSAPWSMEKEMTTAMDSGALGLVEDPPSERIQGVAQKGSGDASEGDDVPQATIVQEKSNTRRREETFSMRDASLEWTERLGNTIQKLTDLMEKMGKRSQEMAPSADPLSERRGAFGKGMNSANRIKTDDIDTLRDAISELSELHREQLLPMLPNPR